MSEWKECKLNDVIELVGGGTPKTTVLEYWGGDIPWLSVVDFNTENKFVCNTEKTITNEGLKNSSTKLLDEGDIIISARGTVGATAVLKKKMAFNQSCYGIKSIADISDSNYLYYLIKFSIANLQQMSHGGVFDTITRETFNYIDIHLPPLPEQRAIAGVLSSLDDKIDLLHRQNKTLEGMAEALWRKMFVEDADPGWKKINISEIIEVRDGTHDSPKESAEGFYLITSRHLKEGGIDFANAYKISEEDYDQINIRSRVEKNDLLFSMIGTLGLLHFVDEEPLYAIKNIGLFKSSQKPEFTKFLYLLLKSPISKDFIFENTEGSTQEYIALGSLRSFKFAYPGDIHLKKFDEIIEPYFNKVFQNKFQIHTLSHMRDTLLQKLMNGEVRVNYE
ncbi:MAG: restriction endonuclease subunit S [Deltaproteobacteria bacterium]|nr:restriction endonuclease subunit S [Deltaproteobacteria bacterium]